MTTLAARLVASVALSVTPLTPPTTPSKPAPDIGNFMFPPNAHIWTVEPRLHISATEGVARNPATRVWRLSMQRDARLDSGIVSPNHRPGLG